MKPELFSREFWIGLAMTVVAAVLSVFQAYGPALVPVPDTPTVFAAASAADAETVTISAESAQRIASYLAHARATQPATKMDPGTILLLISGIVQLLINLRQNRVPQPFPAPIPPTF